MQYVIKLKKKLKINRNRNEHIYLNGCKCRLLQTARTTNTLFLESFEDLMEPINKIAQFSDIELLMLDDLHFQKRFNIARKGRIGAYQDKGKLLEATGRCSSDTSIQQLYHYLRLCDKPF